MRTRVAIGAAVLAAAALALFMRPALFKRDASPSLDMCDDVPVAAYVPDVAIDEGRGVAYLAYLDVSKRATGRTPRGTVMLTDLNVAEPTVRAALVTDPPDFQPVALSLYVPAQGARRLLVVDRGKGAQSSVRIFEQSSSGAFELVKSVQDARLTHPVVIEAVGPDQFYARNENEVVYYDGTHVKVMPTDAKQAAPRGHAYVSQKLRKQLEVTELDSGNSRVLLCAADPLKTS